MANRRSVERDPQKAEDRHAAAQEEQSLLQAATTQAQIQHLLTRAVRLNSDARRLARELEDARSQLPGKHRETAADEPEAI
jgi:hypothetical protein